MYPHFGSSLKTLLSWSIPFSPQSTLNSTSLPSALTISKPLMVCMPFAKSDAGLDSPPSSRPNEAAQSLARLSRVGRAASRSVRAMNNASFARQAEKRARTMSSGLAAAPPRSTRSTAPARSPWSARSCSASTFFRLRLGAASPLKPRPAWRGNLDPLVHDSSCGAKDAKLSEPSWPSVALRRHRIQAPAQAINASREQTAMRPASRRRRAGIMP
mmetsp:Transcript_124485/g.387601  ORF Transcript_124485/g.387601 Transcript_124485/m.387601 type:complete len:215 (+) Transcript_124485:57-701(+)